LNNGKIIPANFRYYKINWFAGNAYLSFVGSIGANGFVAIKILRKTAPSEQRFSSLRKWNEVICSNIIGKSSLKSPLSPTSNTPYFYPFVIHIL
jgi:hypothetical protein